MKRVSDEEEFVMGEGWEDATYLSSRSPAPTEEEVRKTIARACVDCTVLPYGGESLLVSHPSMASNDGRQQSGPGYSHFLVVSWEGPLGNERDGGLAVIEVLATPHSNLGTLGGR
jgi:hypothetical protein